jgi:hypothetical protein
VFHCGVATTSFFMRASAGNGDFSGWIYPMVIPRGAPRRFASHSGAMRSIEPGISRFPDAQLRI